MLLASIRYIRTHELLRQQREQVHVTYESMWYAASGPVTDRFCIAKGSAG